MDNEDDNDMAEKVLKRLYEIIFTDPSLREFSLLPADSLHIDKNVSPIKYLWNEHCLGLDTWCAGLIFKYAQNCIFKLRKNRAYRNQSDQMDMYLTGALLIQPEVTTFWNIKRELHAKGDLEVVEKELHFSKLILSFKPKSSEAFSYRMFIIKKFIELLPLLENEEVTYYRKMYDLEVIMLDRVTCNTPNNYHAWNYRIWLFDNIVFGNLPKTELKKEFNFSENWIFSHVSEHTGFHYRQHILNCFKEQNQLPDLANCDKIYPLLESEFLEEIDESDVNYHNQYFRLLIYELFELLPNLHSNFPGHETIWYHRRYAFYQIYSTICKLYGIRNKPEINKANLPNDVNIIESDVQVVFANKSDRQLALESSILFKTLIGKERELLDNLSTRYERHLNDHDLLPKYEKWLRCILGVYV